MNTTSSKARPASDQLGRTPSYRIPSSDSTGTMRITEEDDGEDLSSIASGTEDEEAEEDDFLQSLDEGDDGQGEFDAVRWLNQRLDTAIQDHPDAAATTSSANSSALAPLPVLDNSLSSIITEIAIVRNSINSSITREITSSSAAIPSLGSDVQWIAKAATEVQAHLDQLQNHSETNAEAQQDGLVALPSSSSKQTPLARLSQLHTLHSQITSYQSLLRLASSWSTLSSDVTSLLAEAGATSSATDYIANLDSASMRLREATESLHVFIVGDDVQQEQAKEKRDLLLRLTNALEETVAPKLLATIGALDSDSDQSATAAPSPSSSSELETINSLSSILDRVGRHQRFTEYWRSTRTESLLNAWRQQISTEATSGSVASSLPIVTLLNHLVALASTERFYAPLLFPSQPLEAMLKLLVSALQNLDPPLQQRIESFCNVSGGSGDAQLRSQESLKALRALREKGKEIAKITSRMAAATSPLAGGSSTRSTAKGSNGAGRRGSGAEGSPKATRQEQSDDHRISPSSSPKASRKAAGASLSPMHERKVSLSQRSSRQRMPAKRQSSSFHALDTGSGAAPETEEDKEFAEALYAALLPLWDSFATTEATLLHSLWSAESKSLAAMDMNRGPQHQNANVSLTAIMDHLSRSWTAAAEVSEDAMGRGLEVTRGVVCAGLCAAIDNVAASCLNESAVRIEERCLRMWSGSLAAGGRGSEWNAFGEVATSLAGFKKLMERALALQDQLARSLHEAATIVQPLLLTDCTSAALKAAASQLVQLRDIDGSAIAGTSPSTNEMAVLLSQSKVIRSQAEQTARSKVITLAQRSEQRRPTAGGLAFANGSMSSDSPSSELSLLPLLGRASRALLAPLLHSLLVLPLTPLLSQLASYPDLPHWSASTLPGAMSNEFQLNMPEFSLGPSEVMQSVGEGLLGLVRELEGWIETEGVQYGVSWLAADAIRRQGTASTTASTAAFADDPEAAMKAKQARRKSGFLPLPAERQASTSSIGAESAATAAGLSAALLSADESRSPTAGISVSPNSITPPMTRLGSAEPASHEPGASQSRQASQSTPNAGPDLLPKCLAQLLEYLVECHILARVLPRLPRREAMSNAGWRQLEADMDYLKRIVGALEGDQSDGASAAVAGATPAAAPPANTAPGAGGAGTSLASWSEYVGVGISRDATNQWSYTSPFSSSSLARGSQTLQVPRDSDEPISRVSSASPGLDPETSRVKRMLQAQRKQGTGTPTTPTTGSNQPRPSRSVDLREMNVGMGW